MASDPRFLPDENKWHKVTVVAADPHRTCKCVLRCRTGYKSFRIWLAQPGNRQPLNDSIAVCEALLDAGKLSVDEYDTIDPTLELVDRECWMLIQHRWTDDKSAVFADPVRPKPASIAESDLPVPSDTIDFDDPVVAEAFYA